MYSKPFTFIGFITLILLSGCCKDKIDENVDFRQEMRNFVIDLAAYARTFDPDFIVIPQNGQELVSSNGEGSGTPMTDYLASIDATGREDLFYGYNGDDKETPQEARQQMLDLCLFCEQNNVEVLAIDYCSTPSKMDHSYQQNHDNGFISFAADQRNLNNIPAYPSEPYQVNADDIQTISQAKNFLYLINSEKFSSKQDFINAVQATNYDALIMDLFHVDAEYTAQEIAQLKTKQNGGKRLVICYLSIGEAEDYRYYWQSDWKKNQPDWLGCENPNWKGNYKVNYWQAAWQDIIYGNDHSYLKKIINAQFDGVYLDIIDAFDYYENL